MAKVNLADLQKEAEKKAKHSDGVETIRVGEKTYYKGAYLEDTFDNYTECVQANSEAKSKKDLKAQGLNEFGQTKEQVELHERVQKLLVERSKIAEQLAAKDAEIGRVRRGEQASEPVKSSKK